MTSLESRKVGSALNLGSSAKKMIFIRQEDSFEFRPSEGSAKRFEGLAINADWKGAHKSDLSCESNCNSHENIHEVLPANSSSHDLPSTLDMSSTRIQTNSFIRQAKEIQLSIPQNDPLTGEKMPEWKKQIYVMKAKKKLKELETRERELQIKREEELRVTKFPTWKQELLQKRCQSQIANDPGNERRKTINSIEIQINDDRCPEWQKELLKRRLKKIKNDSIAEPVAERRKFVDLYK